jgi:osmotically-inducible protein OsmY
MSITVTSEDQWLRELIVHQMACDPTFDASLVGVSARYGIVTLSGYVDTYAAKLAAERAARRVCGVRAVANDLEVKLALGRIDPDIAKEAIEALTNRIDLPLGITVTVRNGIITLGGIVESMHQRMAAENAVSFLCGVKGVFNHIMLRPAVEPKDVQRRIMHALHGHPGFDRHRIHVETTGGTVFLSGNVQSWAEKDEAQRAAWLVPGVTTVDNRITVVQ